MMAEMSSEHKRKSFFACCEHTLHDKREIITKFCRRAINTKHAVSLNVEIKPTYIIEIMVTNYLGITLAFYIDIR